MPAPKDPSKRKEWIEKISKNVKKAWAKPDIKKKISGKNNSKHVDKVAFVCLQCGVIKYLLPCDAKTRKYCSRKCHDDAGHTKETIEKIRKAMSGENHPRGMLGKKQTLEAIEKIRKKRLSQKILFKDTSIEIKMQNILRKNNIKFEKQKPLLKKFIVDIFIEPNTVIECDGDYWHNREDIKQKDVIKNLELKKAGYQLLRFWEYDINNDIEKCFNIIKNEYEKNIMLRSI